tara:strand:+ start:8569 stop:9738 length:1170 start_codon:yes stop_codon:yes gene_type:complete
VGRATKNDLIIKYQNEFESRFKDKTYCTAIAPGRINIIGEHTDYNLGLAMPIAIDRWICSIVSIRKDNKIRIYSTNFDEQIFLSIDQLDEQTENWKKYVFGCIQVFINKYNINIGFNILIGGNIPIGFGMSSSASLEVSLLSSLHSACKIHIDYHAVLELSNKVEKEFLGIQSGVLDQYASIFSKKNKPILIDFSSLTHTYVNSNIRGASWLIVNSMVQRVLAESKYNERVNECQLALKVINASNEKNIKIYELKKYHLKQLKDYPILYKRIHHIISENNRVMLMKQALENRDLDLIGVILNESHVSLSKDYQVSCVEIDAIIQISRKQKGFYGGRIMGGGFGGCCICLVKNSQKSIFIENLVSEFNQRFSYDLKVENVNFTHGLTLVN